MPADERARSVLGLLGWEPHHARTLAMQFRRHTIRQFEEMLPHVKDEARFIAMAKAGRQQLEELFAQERKSADRNRREGWSGEPPADPESCRLVGPRQRSPSPTAA